MSPIGHLGRIIKQFAAVLWMVVKQILNNWRIEGSLVLGLTMAVAVVAAVPIYTSGALEWALWQEWPTRAEQGRQPDTIMINFWNRDNDLHAASYDQWKSADTYLQAQLPKSMGDTPQIYAAGGNLGINRIVPLDQSEPPAKEPYADIEFISNMKGLVDITDGEWPGDALDKDGAVPAIVDENTLEKLNLLVGHNYDYQLPIKDEKSGETAIQHIVVHITGTFKAKKETASSPEWIYAPPFEKDFFVSQKLFVDHFINEMGFAPAQYNWYWVFNYRNVKVQDLPYLKAQLEQISTRTSQLLPNTSLWMSPVSVWDLFIQRSQKVKLLLFVLSIPILAMVFYYIMLAAGLTVQRRRNEIAMLRSRGAATLQIVFSYLVEWALLCAVALIIGPWVGLLIADIMGASAGFLSFVNRAALPVAMVADAFRYGIWAMVVAVFACLLPVFGATRFSIVTFRQDLARSMQNPVLHKYFVDVLLLVAAWYGYRQMLQQTALAQAAKDANLFIDPLLFIVPMLFLLGGGLLALRIFPWVMKLLAWITDRWSGVSWALMARQLARSPGQYTPLLMLLILTVSLGIYAAATARTLDKNFQDSIGYQHGADIVFSERWTTVSGGAPEADASAAASGGAADAFFGGGGSSFFGDSSDQTTTELVEEPPFYVHKSLPGVIDAARVLKESADASIGGNWAGQGTLMAIVPTEFAQVTWWRSDIDPYYRNAYLNLLIKYHEGVLVSAKFFKDNHLKLGDWITLQMQGQKVDFFVVGQVDLWPTMYPKDGPFFIANLDYLQEQSALRPYDVWLKIKPGADLQKMVDTLRDQNVWVVNVQDAQNELVKGRTAPDRMGFYGMLTIGFIVSVFVTIMGFFLYTFLSLRNRVLQFGVLRAMGLSVWQLITMLALEQLFSVGLGLGLGSYLGAWASRLFLPFLQAAESNQQSVPPFLIVINDSDLYKIWAVLGSILLIALVVLAGILSRLRLHQAVKLGEET
ncbi:MAG TPA: FtsX-like permease family protein [Limnochordia bacterium]|nr:FtsX-like permease family protein [Limnochordia bacterium]